MKSGSSLPRTATPLLWLRKGLCSCVVGGRVHHSLTGYSVCPCLCFDVCEFWLVLGRRSPVLFIHGQHPSEPGKPLED